MTAAPSWIVVLDAAGTVIGVAGGAPSAWRGRSVVELGAEAPQIAAVGATLVDEAQREDAIARRTMDVAVGGTTRAVEILVAMSIGIVRRRADVGAIVRHAAAPFRGQAAARDVALTLELPEVSLEVLADAPKLLWAVATLIGNALRFSRAGTRRLPGGTIEVSAARAKRGGHDVAVIEIKDDGPGIDEGRRANLFSEENGAGVSLRMTREVALAHGGELEVESSTGEDHGTRVRISLPIP